MRNHDPRNGSVSVVMASVLLLLLLGQVGAATDVRATVGSESARSSPTTEATEEDESSYHIGSVLNQDAPEVWETVNAFSVAPSAKNTADAFAILEEVLVTWSSHPAGVVTTIFDAIADHRIESGREYLLRFVRVDPEKPQAVHIIRSAVRALSSIDGPGTLEELLSLARKGPDDVAATVACALGEMGDPRAIPTLEMLAQRPSPRLRSRALSALAEYCSETSVDIAIENVGHRSGPVRNSAAWWLANCGNPEHVSHLEALLDDTDSLVRANAVRGLLRLQSKGACGRITALLDDDSSTVANLAREYSEFCGRSSGPGVPCKGP